MVVLVQYLLYNVSLVDIAHELQHFMPLYNNKQKKFVQGVIVVMIIVY